MPIAKCIENKRPGHNYAWYIFVGKDYEYSTTLLGSPLPNGFVTILKPEDGGAPLVIHDWCFDLANKPSEVTAVSCPPERKAKKLCSCQIRDLMAYGCKCGGS